MNLPASGALAGILVVCGASMALAQPARPDFAPPNLSASGVRALAANCAACHGTAGRAVPGSSVGALAGKPREEIAQMLAQFKAGTRPATVMHQIAKAYDDAEIAALADHFARLPRQEVR
jgi:cytochrome subunit of sulfide dehydrogenase